MSCTCPQHGPYVERSHHCPRCMAAARSLVKSLHHHAVTGQLANFRTLPVLFDYLHVLLAGVTVDGKIPADRSSSSPETLGIPTEQGQGERQSEKGGSSC